MARPLAVPDNRPMDETPEELEQIRREAAAIDPYQYRTRRRRIAAIAVGALAAGLVWVGLELYDRARNPCQRLRDHYCQATPGGPNCTIYDGLMKESVEDESPKMRSTIRDQCDRKIRRLKEDDGVTVK
jgi:hypothetical protein